MTDRVAAAQAAQQASPAVEVAWLAALCEVGERGAHALRNRLNAVAVNLEVVRSRVARSASVETNAVSRFADLASSQLEVASEATGALLSLLRAESSPVDVRALAERVARVLPNVTVVAAPPGTGGAHTAVAPEVVRVIVVRAILDALAGADRIECAITVTEGIFLDVRTSPAGTADGAFHLDPQVAALAAQYGVEVRRSEGTAAGAELRLVFPATTRIP